MSTASSTCICINHSLRQLQVDHICSTSTIACQTVLFVYEATSHWTQKIQPLVAERLKPSQLCRKPNSNSSTNDVTLTTVCWNVGKPWLWEYSSKLFVLSSSIYILCSPVTFLIAKLTKLSDSCAVKLQLNYTYSMLPSFFSKLTSKFALHFLSLVSSSFYPI